MKPPLAKGGLDAKYVIDQRRATVLRQRHNVSPPRSSPT
jgi:hypothetical protein